MILIKMILFTWETIYIHHKYFLPISSGPCHCSSPQSLLYCQLHCGVGCCYKNSPLHFTYLPSSASQIEINVFSFTKIHKTITLHSLFYGLWDCSTGVFWLEFCKVLIYQGGRMTSGPNNGRERIKTFRPHHCKSFLSCLMN